MSEGFQPGRAYTIAGQVAKGGMGAILSARDNAIGRTVAMKVLLEGKQLNPAARERFQREAQILGQLEHPNIVPMHEMGVNEHGQPFYTMKFVKGRTLQEVINALRNGDAAMVKEYPLSQLLTIFQKVCDAVAYAHAKGVVHRDLKPENIMLGKFGEVLVMDWGIAKVTEDKPVPADEVGSLTHVQAAEEVPDSGGTSGTSLTMDGTVIGTPQYMAPEQAAGRLAEIDERTDVFSLGGILYGILTLRPPTGGTTLQEILTKVINGTIPPPVFYNSQRRLNADGTEGQKAIGLRHCPDGMIPEALSAVAMKAMSVEPARRYQNVSEFQADVTAYQGGFATGAENARVFTLLKLFFRRHRTLAAVSLAAFTLLATVITVAFVRVTQERNRAGQTLASLERAAPALAAQARVLVAEHKLDEAVATLDFALSVAPQSADFHLQRAHLLQAALKLADAAEGYRHVLALRPDDTAAKSNLALCQELLARSKGATPSSADQLLLLRAILDQKRELDAAPLALQLGKGDSVAAAAIEEVVRPWKQLAGWNKVNGRVTRRGDGGWRLSLEGLALSDLSPLARLRGLPVADLGLKNNPIEDLSPLSGLPLLNLDCALTKVRSLVPLRGMPLRRLNLNRCGTVTSLDGLQGMPLESLDIYDNPVTDLTPLRGAPLKSLDLGFQNQISTLAGLEGAPLERLISGAESRLQDISALRGAPLREAHFPSALIQDFSVLATRPKLELVAFNPAAPGASALRSMTQLKTIAPGGRIVPMKDYWAEMDAKKAGKK